MSHWYKNRSGFDLKKNKEISALFWILFISTEIIFVYLSKSLFFSPNIKFLISLCTIIPRDVILKKIVLKVWLMTSPVNTSEFLLAKQVILYTIDKEILCWLILAEKPYLENQWILSYSPSNIIWCHHLSPDEFGKFEIYYLLYIRVGIRGLWFVNHKSISWFHEPKICKTFPLNELFFPKYKLKKICSNHICLSVCLSVCLSELNEWGWMIKEQNSINYVVIH